MKTFRAAFSRIGLLICLLFFYRLSLFADVDITTEDGVTYISGSFVLCQGESKQVGKRTFPGNNYASAEQGWSMGMVMYNFYYETFENDTSWNIKWYVPVAEVEKTVSYFICSSSSNERWEEYGLDVNPSPTYQVQTTTRPIKTKVNSDVSRTPCDSLLLHLNVYTVRRAGSTDTVDCGSEGYCGPLTYHWTIQGGSYLDNDTTIDVQLAQDARDQILYYHRSAWTCECDSIIYKKKLTYSSEPEEENVSLHIAPGASSVYFAPLDEDLTMSVDRPHMLENSTCIDVIYHVTVVKDYYEDRGDTVVYLCADDTQGIDWCGRKIYPSTSSSQRVKYYDTIIKTTKFPYDAQQYDSVKARLILYTLFEPIGGSTVVWSDPDTVCPGGSYGTYNWTVTLGDGSHHSFGTFKIANQGDTILRDTLSSFLCDCDSLYFAIKLHYVKEQEWVDIEEVNVCHGATSVYFERMNRTLDFGTHTAYYGRSTNDGSCADTIYNIRRWNEFDEVFIDDRDTILCEDDPGFEWYGRTIKPEARNYSDVVIKKKVPTYEGEYCDSVRASMLVRVRKKGTGAPIECAPDTLCPENNGKYDWYVTLSDGSVHHLGTIDMGTTVDWLYYDTLSSFECANCDSLYFSIKLHNVRRPEWVDIEEVGVCHGATSAYFERMNRTLDFGTHIAYYGRSMNDGSCADTIYNIRRWIEFDEVFIDNRDTILCEDDPGFDWYGMRIKPEARNYSDVVVRKKIPTYEGEYCDSIHASMVVRVRKKGTGEPISCAPDTLCPENNGKYDWYVTLSDGSTHHLGTIDMETTVDGTYYDTLSSFECANCDSLYYSIQLHNVRSPSYRTIEANICYEETGIYFEPLDRTLDFGTANAYYGRSTNDGACADTIYDFRWTRFEEAYSIQKDTFLCEGAPMFRWNGSYIAPIDGKEYPITVKKKVPTYAGEYCDSIYAKLTVHIVKKSDTIWSYDTLCHTYSYYRNWTYESGEPGSKRFAIDPKNHDTIYYTTVKAQSCECDSLIYADKIHYVDETKYRHDTVAICYGSSTPYYDVIGDFISGSGVYVFGKGDCPDSIAYIHVNNHNDFDPGYMPYSTPVQTETACDSYKWTPNASDPTHTITCTETGVYYDTLKTEDCQCDSIYYTLDLTIHKSAYVDSTYYICAGDSYDFYDNITDETTTFVAETTIVHSTAKHGIHTIHGCDSTFVFHLVILPAAKTVDAETGTVCTGTPFYWDTYAENKRKRDDESLYISEAGTFYDTIYSFLTGCDSLYVSLTTTKNDTSYSITNTFCCYADLPFTWNGKTYNNSTTDKIVLENAVGCDSMCYLILNVSTPHYNAADRDTIICNGTSFQWGEYTVTESGTYTSTVKNIHGCDSLTGTINVETLECCVYLSGITLLHSINCPEDENYSITLCYEKGQPKEYKLDFSQDAVARGFVNANGTFNDLKDNCAFIEQPLPSDRQPNRYLVLITVSDTCGRSYEYIDTLEINYPNTIIEQKWSNVLAILNEKYNGGYSFERVRWYKNGELIENAFSYYLITDTDVADNAAYQARLVRTGEKDPIYTCPIYLKEYTNAQANITERYATLVNTNVSVNDPTLFITANAKGTCRVYNTAGKLLVSQDFEANETGFSVKVPPMAQSLLVVLELTTGEKESYVVVVR